MTPNRHAVIVTCSVFDSGNLVPLPGTSQDGVSIRELIERHGDVPKPNIRFLSNPALDEVKEAITDAAMAIGKSKDSDGCLVLYFATHAATGPDGTLYIMLKDGDPDRKTGSALSSSFIVETIMEQGVPTSISVLDVCHAEGQAAVMARLFDLRPSDGGQKLIEGHFVLAACRWDETSKESQFGGNFTRAVIEAVDHIGKENPRIERLPAHMIAAHVVDEAKRRKLSQVPSWSGFTIRRSVFFSRNSHFDQHAPGGHPPISLRSIQEDDRLFLRDAVVEMYNATNRIGTGIPWADGIAKSLDLVHAGASKEGVELFVERIVEQLFERIGSGPSDLDLSEILLSCEKALVVLGRGQLLDAQVFAHVCYSLTELADNFLGAFGRLRIDVDDRWFMDFGFSAIGLAPVFLSETVGTIALLAGCADFMGRSDIKETYATLGGCILEGNERLWRLATNMQLPDIAASLDLVREVDEVLCQSLNDRMIEFRTAGPAGVREPVTNHTVLGELGYLLCNRYLGIDSSGRESADESTAALLAMACSLGKSQLELNSIAARFKRDWEETVLYRPLSFEAQFRERMSDCNMHSWPLSTEDSLASLVSDLPSIIQQSKALHPGKKERIASLAASRLYRNRSGYWLLR